MQTLDDPADPDNPKVEPLAYTLTKVDRGETELVCRQTGHLPAAQCPLEQS